MRLRRRSNCAVNSGLIAIPTRRYSALTDYHSAGTSGLDRRGSLPSSVLHFTPLVRIERKVSQFESSRCDVRSMKFDTSIDKNHIKRLLFLVGILCVFTFSAISYSFYKVLKKKYSNWVSWFRDEMHHLSPLNIIIDPKKLCLGTVSTLMYLLIVWSDYNILKCVTGRIFKYIYPV